MKQPPVRKLMDSHSVEGDTKIWQYLAKVMSMASDSQPVVHFFVVLLFTLSPGVVHSLCSAAAQSRG